MEEGMGSMIQQSAAGETGMKEEFAGKDSTERVELGWHTFMDGKGGVLFPLYIMAECVRQGMNTFGVTDYNSILAWENMAEQAEKMQDETGKVLYGVQLQVRSQQGNRTVAVLAKNREGVSVIYKLVTAGERQKDQNGPWLTAEQLFHTTGREHILIGDCDHILENIFRNAEEGQLEKTVAEYDYILLKTPQCYEKYRKDSAFPEIQTPEDIEDGCEQLILMGEKLQIPVVATCDPYFSTDEQKEACDILRWNQGGESTENMECFLSTEELLDCFDYLSEEKAWKTVVTDSVRVAEQCEKLQLFREKRMYPSRKDSDRRLREICEKALTVKYGQKLHDGRVNEELRERMEWELEAVRRKGTAFLFLVLKELLEKLELKPWDINTRGACGNSLLAFLCDISETDPLEYHLFPYTAFGYGGEKEIDVDLNLPAGLRGRAMEILKEMEGIGEVIPCSTTGLLGEAAAERYMERYYEEKGKKTILSWQEEQERREKIENILTFSFCRWGMHPGGCVLVPEGVEVTDYTPIKCQEGCGETCYYPGEVVSDYFYKLDLLVHDIPEKLGRMSEKAGICLKDIPMEDEGVMEHFTWMGDDTDYPECYGMYEFRGEYVMHILKETVPQNFQELAKVLGIVHGTEVWESVEEFLMEGDDISIGEIPAVREDVFDLFLQHGIEPGLAWKLSEDVRMGKVTRGRSECWKKNRDMLKEHGVEERYLQFCEHVMYLFPRAHAISYMRLVWRLAWFRVYHRDIYDQVMEEE